MKDVSGVYADPLKENSFGTIKELLVSVQWHKKTDCVYKSCQDITAKIIVKILW